MKRYGGAITYVMELPFSLGIEQVRLALKEEERDFAKLRWVIRYEDACTFAEFMQRLGFDTENAENTALTADEILADAGNILEMIGSE